MEQRLRSVEEKLRLTSIAAVSSRASIRSGATKVSDSLNVTPCDHGSSSRSRDGSTTNHAAFYGLGQDAFEQLLASSWVYRRNEHRDEDMSFRSSVLRPSASSVLSELSLANISIVSVIALPVEIHELFNSHWYSDVGTSEPAVQPIELPNVDDSLNEADYHTFRKHRYAGYADIGEVEDLIPFEAENKRGRRRPNVREAHSLDTNKIQVRLQPNLRWDRDASRVIEMFNDTDDELRGMWEKIGTQPMPVTRPMVNECRACGKVSRNLPIGPAK